MSEFYRNLSIEEIEKIIKKKTKMYEGMVDFVKFPGIVMEHDYFVYQGYAKENGFELGSFELYRYIGIARGIELYHFYVEQPFTELSKDLHKERKVMNIRTLHRSRIKSEYEKMSAVDLKVELKNRRLPARRKKEERVRELVEDTLNEIVASELSK